ncbi:MAG: carboxypeptidase regulatory-like domain-containing protein, partial [Candidatus Cybelea sp.]
MQIKRRASLAVVLVGALVLPFAQAAQAGTTGTITGTVSDSSTRAPIAGAEVTASSPSQVAHVTSDASGRFTFLSLA